jgi:hypothetical protein
VAGLLGDDPGPVERAGSLLLPGFRLPRGPLQQRRARDLKVAGRLRKISGLGADYTILCSSSFSRVRREVTRCQQARRTLSLPAVSPHQAAAHGRIRTRSWRSRSRRSAARKSPGGRTWKTSDTPAAGRAAMSGPTPLAHALPTPLLPTPLLPTPLLPTPLLPAVLLPGVVPGAGVSGRAGRRM